jgi:hypothetical protein
LASCDDHEELASIELARLPSANPPGHHAYHKQEDRTEAGSPHEDNEPTSTMSRQPLLMRSSPALGTASSYGGIFPTELDKPDDNDQGYTGRHKNTHKGDALRRVISAEDGTRYGSEETGGLGRTSFQSEGTSRRRKSIAGFEAIAGTQDVRFSSGGLPAFGAFDGSARSSRSTAIFGEDDEEEEDSSDHISILGDDDGVPADDSPYAQVRASVAPYDNTSLSINTPRMWCLSMLFAIFGSSTNLFFSLRYPSVSITPVIALLIVHPLGLLWDQTLKRDKDPEQIFVNGLVQGSRATSGSPTPPSHVHSSPDAAKDRWRRRLRLWLAQGQWNEKEHCCVFISSNVSFGFAFATDVCNKSTHLLVEDC